MTGEKFEKLAIILVVAIGLATVVGITTHQIFTTDSTSKIWQRVADDVYFETIDSGTSYMYWEGVSAGIVDRVEPTPEEFVSDIRKIDISYYSDKTGKLCRTYISWDTDLEPGDHMVLDAIYKYQVDMDGPANGFEPTVLVDREVVDFQVTKNKEGIND